MSDRSSILVLDDGELDNVHRMLLELELDAVRLKGPEIKRSVEAPRDLLISAGRRTLGNMPEVRQPDGASEKPTWVCIHNQDFLPLRERLRKMGVHYLLQNALDEDSRRRFLLQLLRAGGERRRNLRLPLGGEIHYSAGAGDETGRLVELSVESCRILASSPIDVGSSVSVLLPPSLGGGSDLKLSGTVLRTEKQETHAGRVLHPTFLRFDALDESQSGPLESIIRGERIGTRITALAERPQAAQLGSVGADQDAANAERAAKPASPRHAATSESAPKVASKAEVVVPERRSQTRHGYERPVQVLGEVEPVLARDLSMSGVRLAESRGLEDGAEVMVALYGAAREEPIVISADVVCAAKDEGAGLRFGPMSPSVREALQKLLRSQPILDALDEPDPEAGRTVIVELRNTAV